MIQETSLLAATNADVLSAGRLNALPYNGQLVLEFLASLADATNFWTLTIALPGGDVPVDAQLVPGANPTIAGVLDERQLVRYSFPATQGGHFTVTLTEAGTALCTFRATLLP